MTIAPSDDYLQHVLVTGGAGFIGSHLLRSLLKKYPDYHFTCMDKLSYASNHESLQILNQFLNFQFIQGDLVDYNTLYQFLVIDFPKTKITSIISLAAESCVDRSFDDPLFFTTNNVLGGQNLLECYRILINQNPETKFQFLHVSTDEVYGEQISNKVDENDKLNPTNPYSATKAALDLIIKSYQYSYNLPITVIRSNNIFGPNQYPEKIIPVILEKLRKVGLEPNHPLSLSDRIPLHGNGNHKRSYLYIDDFIEAIDLIWHKFITNSSEVNGEIFNIGSTFEIDNLSLTKLVIDLYFDYRFHKSVNNYDDYIIFVKDRHYNDCRYLVKCDKLETLGWKQKVSLVEGLKRLMDIEI